MGARAPTQTAGAPMPPHPALDFQMWGRCGLPTTNPHMPHTRRAQAEPEARTRRSQRLADLSNQASSVHGKGNAGDEV